jgi:L-rhamnose-H+ transport protein
MNTLIGLLIISVGSFGQSSSYVPIMRVKQWSWESFWLMQGIFAWLIFPFLGALLAVPSGSSLTTILTMDVAASVKSLLFGMLWGVGGLTFGLSMRYLGIAMGQSVALGTCSAFGTLIPAMLAGTNLFSGDGLILLLGVSIALAGIAVIGFAGSLRTSEMSEEDQRKAVKDFALTKGLLVALLAGVMSACFALGLDAGRPLFIIGTNELFRTLPATLMVTVGGFITNAAFCIYSNFKNKTFGDYGKKTVWVNNLLFCMLAGGLWYSQFFGFSVGIGFLESGSVMMAFSWSILMTLNILFSNFWGIRLKEWEGVSRKTLFALIVGFTILVLSLLFPELIIQIGKK